MGTSVNQGSPRTRNWEAVQSTYKSDVIPLERVLQEVWRAATNQPEGDLAAQLGAPIISRLRAIAIQGATVGEVANATNLEIARSRQASLGVEIARRAAIQCSTAKNRPQAFSERLFAEASNYLISRDLPGFVGLDCRNRTVSDSRDFKQSVVDIAVEVTREIGGPQDATAKSWRKHTEEVVSRLRGSRRE